MVVLATGVTAAARMLPVLAHAAITHGDLAALVARLSESGRLQCGEVMGLRTHTESPVRRCSLLSGSSQCVDLSTASKIIYCRDAPF